MTLEDKLRTGLRSSKYMGGLTFGVFIAVLIVSWFFGSSPYLFDSFEMLALGYIFGCGLGIMTGRDQIRIYVKDFLQSSDETEDV